MSRFSLFTFIILSVLSCHRNNSQVEEAEKPTQAQQQMLDNGWTLDTPGEDMSEEYGITPTYGMQDNYFDITIGNGCNVAVKIVDQKTEKCIRYVYVSENSTTTVQEIPQGVYYLKLAYGYDWMSFDTDSIKLGKFSRNVSYEKSQGTFDFGVKNSQDEISYKLEINVVNSKLENNFLTTPIDEKDFFK